MTEKAKYKWVPNVAVGEFRFGTPVSEYVDAGRVTVWTHEPELGGDWYADDSEDPIVTVDEDGLIDDILCDEGLVYKNRNLIGLRIDDIIEVLGRNPDEYGEPIEMDDNDIQVTATFYELGLQLWLREGVAVSAVVSVAVEDEETESGVQNEE